MSLIRCPECNDEVSNKAIACPHCGYPMSGRAFIARSEALKRVVRTYLVAPIVKRISSKPKV